MINQKISECRKLVQKEYKTKHVWVGKVIHWELCKKLKFDHTYKWYMHRLESVLENVTHKILWDFVIQTDHLMLTRRLDLMIINTKKENLHNSGLFHPGRQQSENQRKRKEKQVLRPCQRTKKVMEHKNDSDTIYNWYTQDGPQRLCKRTGRV